MPIYTKKGDTGQTSLFDKTRVFKDNIRVDTYGTIDELNSILGVISSHLPKKTAQTKKELEIIQHDLFEIGAVLANPSQQVSEKFNKQLEEHVRAFETSIDQMTEKMPELKNFILPGGGRAGSFLQLARTVARRAERRIVALTQKEPVAPTIIIYFNRLSDLFFTMSRFVNFLEKEKETIWKQSK